MSVKTMAESCDRDAERKLDNYIQKIRESERKAIAECLKKIASIMERTPSDSHERFAASVLTEWANKIRTGEYRKEGQQELLDKVQKAQASIDSLP